MKNHFLENAQTAIRAANHWGISDIDRAELCDVVLESTSENLTEIEPQRLGEEWPYHLVRQNRLLQEENEMEYCIHAVIFQND